METLQIMCENASSTAAIKMASEIQWGGGMAAKADTTAQTQKIIMQKYSIVAILTPDKSHPLCEDIYKRQQGSF